MELALTLPRLAKAGYKLPPRGEFLDAVVAPVGHIHIALGVHGHAPGEVELAILRASLAPVQEVLAIGRELLDTMVVLVHNVHVIVSVNGDTRRTIEFASTTAADAPFTQEGACGIEKRNAVVVLVGDVQALLAIKGHRHGPGELPVTGAKTPAELAQVLLIQRADAHPDGGGTRRVAAVQHEDAPIPTHGHVVWVGKATPVVAIVHDTDGLNVLQGNA